MIKQIKRLESSNINNRIKSAKLNQIPQNQIQIFKLQRFYITIFYLCYIIIKYRESIVIYIR